MSLIRHWWSSFWSKSQVRGEPGMPLNLSKVTQNSDPWIATNWSASNTFYVGDNSSAITRLMTDSAGALIIFKTNGLFVLDRDGNDIELLSDKECEADARRMSAQIDKHSDEVAALESELVDARAQVREREAEIERITRINALAGTPTELQYKLDSAMQALDRVVKNEGNHYDRYWQPPPEALADSWLDEFEGHYREALTDAFCDDAAAVALMMIAEIRRGRQQHDLLLDRFRNLQGNFGDQRLRAEAAETALAELRANLQQIEDGARAYNHLQDSISELTHDEGAEWDK